MRDLHPTPEAVLPVVPRIRALADCRPSTAASRYRSITRVIQDLHERLDEPHTLKSMARVAWLSPFHFNRVFRSVTGLPPVRFLFALRIQRAKRLLLTTRLRVIDICYEVGYSSPGSFGTSFTRLVGLAPREFRRLGSALDVSELRAACAADPRPRPRRPGVEVRLSGPAGADSDPLGGVCFAGLYRAPFPGGEPVACAVRAGEGACSLGPVPEGRYHLSAAALSLGADDPVPLCLGEEAVIGQVGPVLVRQGAEISVPLRPRLEADPPILFALPLVLLQRYREERPAA